MISSLVQPGDRKRYHLLFAAAVAVMTFPIWTVAILPWSDLGDHMARLYILRHFNEVPIFRQYYFIERLPLPNLAIDLIGTPILRIVNPYLAAKLIASLSVMVFAIAVHVFGRAVHGAPTWLAIAAAFFFYNSLLLYGFVNYTWGVAMFLIAAAAWLEFERKRSVGACVLAIVAGSVTYIAHLSGFFFLCVFVGLMSLFAIARDRRISLWKVAGFLPLAPGMIAYISLGRARGDLGTVEWGSLTTKVIHACVLISGYSVWMDAITVAGWLLVAGAVLRYGKLCGRTPLLAVAGTYILAFLVFPSEFHTGSDADTRFVLPAGLMVVLALTVSLPQKMAKPVFSLLLAVLALRVALMDIYWQQAEQIATEQIGLLRQVDEQSRIYPILFLPPGRTEGKIRTVLQHVAGYAVIERNAITGATFAVPGQQPLQHRVPLPYLQVTADMKEDEVKWPQIFANYDYIWIYHASPYLRTYLDSHADLRAQAGDGRLYRIGAGSSHPSPSGSPSGNP
jgi:hypothetical protein